MPRLINPVEPRVTPRLLSIFFFMKGDNMLVILKIKYGSVEQRFNNRIDAASFLKNALETMEVVSYEIKQLN